MSESVKNIPTTPSALRILRQCLGVVLLIMVALSPTAHSASCAANDFQCLQREEAERQRKLQEQKAEQEKQLEQNQRQLQQQEQQRQEQQRQEQQRQQQQIEQQQRQQQIEQQQRLQQQKQQQQIEQQRQQQSEQQRVQPQREQQQPEIARPTQMQPRALPQPPNIQRAPLATDPNLSRFQMNANRNNFTGINRQPIPDGAIENLGHGAIKVNTNNGHQLIYRGNGTLASVTGAGVTATLFNNGQIRTLRTDQLTVNHGPNGSRTVVQQLPGQTTVVATAPQRGYVQKTVNWQGQTYTQRTFVNNGRTYNRLYNNYPFHGIVLVVYVPVVYYNPYYYGWAYFPWSTPVYYNWGWSTSPWYLANSGYFTTSTYYQSPSMWMTDQMMANMMQSSYSIQQTPDQSYDDVPPYPTTPDDAVPDPVYAPVATPLTPELKQSIADQVAQQVLLDNAAAQNPQNAPALTGLPKVLQPNHLFIVSQPLNVASGNAQTCDLTPGDVLQLLATPAFDAITADLSVSASRKGDCPTGMIVSVALTDLQEMQNEFHYQVDRGLQSLNTAQRQQGIPEAPSAAYDPPPRLIGVPPSDPNAANLVLQAQLEADQNEAQLPRTVLGN